MDARPCLPQNKHKLLKCDDSNSSTQWACRANQHVQQCPHSNKFSDETSGSCSCDFSNRGIEQNYGIFTNGKIKNICNYSKSSPVLNETVYIRSKLCPICKSDVSWLPKFAACSKCGHKPALYAVERPYNENLTADQILQEWIGNNQKDGSIRANRCSCKNGKVCAYCRIQTLCKDLLKVDKCRDPNAKGSVDTEACISNISPKQIGKSTSESESRTYLAKVFSELRDLYSLKPKIVKRKTPCEKVCADSKHMKCHAVAVQEKKADLANLNSDVKAKRSKRKVYSYKTVRRYPGTLIGHKTCVNTGKSVPPNMGWLWNADTAYIHRGWKPGAIRKSIKEMMKYFLKDYPVDSLRVSKYPHKQVVTNESEELVQKPTLHICKKKGVYTITMHPLKEASLLKSCADPYVPMKPIRFKIVKNPLMVYGSHIKKRLKKHFHKCTCHKPIVGCCCRTYLDKKRLEFELNKACRCMGIDSLKDTLVLSDTTDSDTEYEFGVTPPAGVIKPHLKNRPDFESRETQYNEKDWSHKPIISMNLKKYTKPIDPLEGRINARGAKSGGEQVHIASGREAAAPGGRGGYSGRGGHGGRGFYGGRGRGGYNGRGSYGIRTGGGPSSASKGDIAGSSGLAAKGFISGAVGGMGGVGGNSGGGRIRNVIRSGERAANFTPLFCNLARRRKAETITCCPPPCIPRC